MKAIKQLGLILFLIGLVALNGCQLPKQKNSNLLNVLRSVDSLIKQKEIDIIKNVNRFKSKISVRRKLNGVYITREDVKISMKIGSSSQNPKMKVLKQKKIFFSMISIIKLKTSKSSLRMGIRLKAK